MSEPGFYVTYRTTIDQYLNLTKKNAEKNGMFKLYFLAVSVLKGTTLIAQRNSAFLRAHEFDLLVKVIIQQ